MGNTCTCITECQTENDDVQNMINDKRPLQDKEKSVLSIQTNFRGYLARKFYKEMRLNAIGFNVKEAVTESNIILLPLVQVSLGIQR